MEMLTDSTPAALRKRAPLSQSQFKRLCLRAAKNSASSGPYIRRVLRYLCRWLQIPDCSELLPPARNWRRRNTQLSVLALYRLLEVKCRYDFDVATVLTRCREGADESS